MTMTRISRTKEMEAFIDELRGKLGDVVDDSSLARAMYSSDASNYRVVPEVDLTPRSREDILQAVASARSHHVPVTVRGGGTSCAGNSVGPGMVMDFSRHMNRVVSIDPIAKRRWSSQASCSATCRRKPSSTGCVSARTRPPPPAATSGG